MLLGACEPVGLADGACELDCEFDAPGLAAWLGEATWDGDDVALGVRLEDPIACELLVPESLPERCWLAEPDCVCESVEEELPVAVSKEVGPALPVADPEAAWVPLLVPLGRVGLGVEAWDILAVCTWLAL